MPTTFVWPRPTVRLIGRTVELARLAELVSLEPAIVVAGPMGIGKTELVRALAAQQTAAGRLPPPAYASLADAVTDRELLERTARALGRDRPSPEPSRVLSALRHLLEREPCTLIWDDAEDASPTVIADALETLRHRPLESRIIVVARELPAMAGVPVFEVPPLDGEGCRELLAAIEVQRGRSLRDEIALRSGGNPLALQLAFAVAPSDALEAVRIAAATSLPATARSLLALLLAAEAPLDVRDLEPLDSGDAIALLSQRALILRDGDRIDLRPGIANAIRASLGPADPATWKALARLAARSLARSSGDPDALIFACRAHARRGGSRRALSLLRTHVAARAAASSAALEKLLAELAAADPRCAPESQLVLAREQLRWGDFEAARRTLDHALAVDLAPRLAQRARILRAEALVRAGEPLSAAQELERARSGAALEVERTIDLGLAELAIFRGELPRARRTLLALAPRTRAVPSLEGRRATALGLSYLLEQRYPQALAWARRARLAYRRRDGGPVDPLAPIVEIAALMGLDQIDRALAAAGREAAGGEPRRDRSFDQGPLVLFQAGVLFRRGEFSAALELGQPAYRALDRRADRIFRAIVAHYSARSAIGLGQLETAEEFVRVEAGIAAEPGLGVLRPTCDFDFALLLEARGKRAEAQERIRRALDGPCRSPLAQIEAWALGAVEKPPRPAHPAVDALLALRSAERDLEEGHLAHALAQASVSARWYEHAGAGYELARSHLARAEALARLGGPADDVLASSAALADKGRYVPIQVGIALVRAAVADRAGRFADYEAALRLALDRAGPELRDAALFAACARAGIAPEGLDPAPSATFRDRVHRLGLDRSAELLAEAADRRWLLAEGELPRGAFDLTIALDRGAALSARASVPLPRQRLLLLESLARAGAAGETMEEMHRTVWGASAYHPLRHRNTIYVALTRLRESLRRLLDGEVLVEIAEGRYRLEAAPVVICRVPKVGSVRHNPLAQSEN